MDDKACCWSITINNPTEEDHQQWAALSSIHWVKETKAQMEKGEEGTLHLQGMVRTQSVRFAALKKALPRAHIEAARQPAALAKYVAKEDTRVASLPTTKTATQADIQTTILGVVLQDLYHSTGMDPLTTDELELLTVNETIIKKHWEVYLDQAVNILIYQGYYGVEFVVSNPQIRTAFKKYLPAILYRTYNARTQVQPPPQTQIQSQSEEILS